jgi:receptor expression-enhancing protein 1/2/3/4
LDAFFFVFFFFTAGIVMTVGFVFCFHVQQKNKKSGGWSPFATKRRPPSPPPQESIFDSNPDAAALAEALRATIGGANPRRPTNGKHY